MPAFPVYQRSHRTPGRSPYDAPTFHAGDARPLGTILAPPGAALTTARAGHHALAVPGVAVTFKAPEAVAAARRGAFGLAWEPAGPQGVAAGN